MPTSSAAKRPTKPTSANAGASDAAPPAAARAPARTRRPDALALLKADHAEVKKLFKAYQKLADKNAEASDRQALAEQICTMLTVHAQIEEELFYPAARDVLGDDIDLVDEADVEHGSAKDPIAQIQSGPPDEGHYNAKVKVLGEYINHHVQEEENEMFPAVKEAGLDTRAVGQQLSERKEALMASSTA
jgi:hemerythrin superfamily protein